MKNNDPFLDKISKKTNVKKEDIFALANSLQSKNLKKEDDIRDFIGAVANMTNKTIEDEKMDKLVDMIKNNKVPKDLNNIM